jgi:hypothetical protein
MTEPNTQQILLFYNQTLATLLEASAYSNKCTQFTLNVLLLVPLEARLL